MISEVEGARLCEDSFRDALPTEGHRDGEGCSRLIRTTCSVRPNFALCGGLADGRGVMGACVATLR